MTTIYIVSNGEYSDYCTLGVFSTPEKAEAFRELRGDCNETEPMELDEYEHAVSAKVWTSRIAIDDGEVEEEGFEQDYCRGTDEHIVPHPRWSLVDQCSFGETLRRGLRVQSAVSQEHATKLAIEARQKYLREHHP